MGLPEMVQEWAGLMISRGVILKRLGKVYCVIADLLSQVISLIIFTILPHESSAGQARLVLQLT